MKLRLAPLAVAFVLLAQTSCGDAPTPVSPVEGQLAEDLQVSFAKGGNSLANALQIPVTGTFTDALGGTGTFTGTLSVTQFVLQNNQIYAVGTLTGTLTNSLGGVIGTITQVLQILVGSLQGSTCDILHLELGPIDLDLLGLVVHVDQIVVDIDAQQGPGNLLGNLLCAIVSALDLNLTGIVVDLLNLILDVLNP